MVDGVEQLRGQRSTTQHDRGNQWEESKVEADTALQLNRIRGAATRSWLPDPKLQEHEERQIEAGYLTQMREYAGKPTGGLHTPGNDH